MTRLAARNIRRLQSIIFSVLLTASLIFCPLPASALSAIGTGVSTASSLVVRSSPSTSASKLGSIPKGTTVTVYALKNGWYQIAYKSGLGWVSGKYIRYTANSSTPSPSPSQPAPTNAIGTGVVKISSGSLNVRSGPGSSYSAIGKLANKTKVTIYELRNGWYRILYNGKTGWISDDYVTYTPASSNPTPTPTASHSPTPTPTNSQSPTPTPTTTPTPPQDDAVGTGTVCNVSTYVNVRSQPSTSSGASIIGKAYKGDVFPVYRTSGSWVEINFKGKHAWIYATYLKITYYSSSSSIVDDWSIYTYDQMKKDIAALKAKYTDKITVSSIGKSVEGRDIPVLIIGSTNAKNQILIHAGIHGREYMNPNIMMMQVEYMLANQSTVYDGQTLAQWMSDACFHIIPMVNPDGITISQTKTGSDDVLAICTLNLVSKENLPSYLMLWKANANGVDLNLQFPAGWDIKPSGTAPANADYKGESPLSEPEAKALANYTQKYPFDITISYHSTGSDIFVQYPQASDSNNALSLSLGNAVAKLTGYTISSTPLSDGAGYKDWALSACGIPSITVETGTVSCPLPYSQFSAIWNQNKNLWPVLVKWARSNTN